VLLNLAVNSRDAMPGGGQLLIATGFTNVREGEARQNPDATPGPCVFLSVSDAGCGIPPELLSRIFEPFFTTKAPGKGTGLGLATVYGIVRQHCGWIEVSSEPGLGTTFRICLPAVPGLPQPALNEPAPPPPRGGKETILVVEDEAILRSLVANVLQRAGYRVLTAESGVAALEVWQKRQGDIDLLFTDMIMPDGLTGKELAEQLLAEQSSLKVILTSGYSPDMAGKETDLIEGRTFLQKPYHPHKLLHTVRNCLDGR
jgi:two-component system, cell cycle sensor histidine kinase and response regulator CckA